MYSTNDAVDDIHKTGPRGLGLEKKKKQSGREGRTVLAGGRVNHSMPSRQGSEMTEPGYRETRRSKDAGKALGPLFPWFLQGHSRYNWPLSQRMVVVLGHLPLVSLGVLSL